MSLGFSLFSHGAHIIYYIIDYVVGCLYYISLGCAWVISIMLMVEAGGGGVRSCGGKGQLNREGVPPFPSRSETVTVVSAATDCCELVSVV